MRSNKKVITLVICLAIYAAIRVLNIENTPEVIIIGILVASPIMIGSGFFKLKLDKIDKRYYIAFIILMASMCIIWGTFYIILKDYAKYYNLAKYVLFPLGLLLFISFPMLSCMWAVSYTKRKKS